MGNTDDCVTYTMTTYHGEELQVTMRYASQIDRIFIDINGKTVLGIRSEGRVCRFLLEDPIPGMMVDKWDAVPDGLQFHFDESTKDIVSSPVGYYVALYDEARGDRPCLRVHPNPYTGKMPKGVNNG